MNHVQTRSPGTLKETATEAPARRKPERLRGQGAETAVAIREASPADRDGLRGMLSRLSSETIYMRFHIPYPNLLERPLVLMLGTDRDDTQVLLAVSEGEVVGHGMYVRLEEGGDEAEVAIVVGDRWQARGIGKLLLRKLAEDAWCRGVEAFVGTVLPENRRMLGLLGTAFAQPSYEFSYGVYQFRALLETLDGVDAEEEIRGAA